LDAVSTSSESHGPLETEQKFIQKQEKQEEIEVT